MRAHPGLCSRGGTYPMRMNDCLASALVLLPLLSAAAESRNADYPRANRALQVRVEAAVYQRGQPVPAHPDNGDERRFPTFFANYTKGLPHDVHGNVDPAAYRR